MYNILKNLNVMFGDSPPQRIQYYYGIWQELFDEMLVSIKGISFHKDLPSHEEILSFTDPKTHTCIILDDVMNQASSSDVVELLFTQISHHRNTSVFYLIQNIFSRGKVARTISLNAKVMHLFNNPRDIIQYKRLGSQLGNSCSLVESFMDCMKDRYGYLIVDLTAECEPLHRLRSKIFPEEYTVIYIPK